MSLPTAAFRQARFGAALFLFASAAAACDGEDVNVPSNPATETYAPSLGVRIADMRMVQEGLYVQDLQVGSGLEAIPGRLLQLQYTGRLANGQQFDSNTDGGIPVELGRGGVIEGWDLGLVGMRPGGKRKLVIGSALAYGATGRDPAIGPNKTLVFDVTLLSVQ